MRSLDSARLGATFLDQRLPGWRDRVNPETLDLRSDCDCVLGQTLGSYTEASNLLGLRQPDLIALGFYKAPSRSWAALTNAWKKILRAA